MSDTRMNRQSYFWICFWLAQIAAQILVLGIALGRIADALNK